LGHPGGIQLLLAPRPLLLADLIGKKCSPDLRSLFRRARTRPAVSVDDVSSDERIAEIVGHSKLPGSVPSKIAQYCLGHFVSWWAGLNDMNGQDGGGLEPTHAEV
jgi:hypothetical protein